MDKQYRSIEVVSAGEADKLKIYGKAVAFDSPTVMFEESDIKYYERISKTALDKCDMSDCCLKYNHTDSTPILARVRGGSLKLEKRKDGLYFEAEMFPTQFAKDCYELVKRDALQCSFAFALPEDGYTYDRETRTRIITKIPKLYDLSIVTLPAYSDTYVKQARSFFEAEAKKEHSEELDDLELAKAKYFFEVVNGRLF